MPGASRRSARCGAHSAPFTDDFLNAVVSPAARFDSAWLLEIADHGYAVDARTAFFPLYPIVVAAVAALTGSTLVAGIAVSVVCSLGALYLLHRFVTLDHGTEVARITVWIVACFPLAFCLSAVYTGGLFLLLSVGSLYAARLGNWPVACACAGLAAGTRSAGVLLVIPLLAVMLYGPRADRVATSARTTVLDLRDDWRPRHRLGPRGAVARAGTARSPRLSGVPVDRDRRPARDLHGAGRVVAHLRAVRGHRPGDLVGNRGHLGAPPRVRDARRRQPRR
jgi:hypothetical protein